MATQPGTKTFKGRNIQEAIDLAREEYGPDAVVVEKREVKVGFEVGDRVKVTEGPLEGFYGVVDEIKERSVLIKVDGDVKLRVDKNSIVRDYTEDAPKA